MEHQVIDAFRKQFAEDPTHIAFAPGRVNLIGGHTDYNEGFVLPAAIDRGMWLAFRPRTDRVMRLYSVNFDREIHLSLDYLTQGRGWQEYPKGVAWALEEHGYRLRGIDAAVVGNVPRGAGLSSSAALEMAFARAFAAASDIEWQIVPMAQAAQQAENEWVGLNCGIMDQLASAAGRRDYALLIDCRTLDLEPVPLPPHTAIAVLDTGTRRSLTDSAYNNRRAACEAAAARCGVHTLRDLTPEQLEARRGILSDELYRRARHVVTENERVLRAAEAARSSDAERFGALINASHASLRDDYEVSSAALNAMAGCAVGHDACYGARLPGAGFGGCCVALIDSRRASSFASAVQMCYTNQPTLESQVILCLPSDGATLKDLHGV
ncbi:MAG: galactokinase [Anaerolineae bacterium]